MPIKARSPRVRTPKVKSSTIAQRESRGCNTLWRVLRAAPLVQEVLAELYVEVPGNSAQLVVLDGLQLGQAGGLGKHPDFRSLLEVKCPF